MQIFRLFDILSILSEDSRSPPLNRYDYKKMGFPKSSRNTHFYLFVFYSDGAVVEAEAVVSIGTVVVFVAAV